MITCCADCSKRYVGCHGKCEEYLKQRAEYEAERDALYEMRRKKAVTYEYTKSVWQKAMQRQSNRKRR